MLSITAGLNVDVITSIDREIPLLTADVGSTGAEVVAGVEDEVALGLYAAADFFGAVIFLVVSGIAHVAVV